MLVETIRATVLLAAVVPAVAAAAADCAAAPLRSTGTTFYYCDCGPGAAQGCVRGNDAHRGTSPSAPRRSWANAAARFGSMNAGDTIALCRTGAWAAGGLEPANARCRAGSGGWPAPAANGDTCDFRDYVPSWGSASSPRPRLTGAFFRFGGTTGGYRLWNLDAAGTAPNTWAVGVSDGAHHIDICNVNFESRTPWGMDGGDADIGVYGFDAPGPLVIRGGSRFAHYSMHGWLGAVIETVVDRTLWEDNANRAHYQSTCNPGAESHQWYIHQNSATAGSQVWTNNEVVTRSGCGGNMVGITGRITNALFENNYVHNEGTDPCGQCGGLSSGPTAEGTAVSNAIIRRNRIQGTWGSVLSCIRNSLVTDNIVTPGIGVGGEDSALCYDGNTTHIEVVNNTTYGGGISFSGSGSNHVLRNNASYRSDGPCFTFGANVSADHNHCASSKPGAVWVAPSSDLSTANFTPANPGPLIRRANQTSYSPTAAGSVTWNPADPGVRRSPPVDIGAMVSGGEAPSASASPDPAKVTPSRR
jgi:hypothetical protein